MGDAVAFYIYLFLSFLIDIPGMVGFDNLFDIMKKEKIVRN